MLPPPVPPSSPIVDDRESRVRALVEQLLPHVEQAARQMAESLVDTPDAGLFGDLEFTLRDRAHDLAAAAHQAGLQGRKKGGTKAAASPAPPADGPPNSSTTSAAHC